MESKPGACTYKAEAPECLYLEDKASRGGSALELESGQAPHCQALGQDVVLWVHVLASLRYQLCLNCDLFRVLRRTGESA